MLRQLVWVLVAASITTTTPADDAQLGPPGDCEVRTTRDTFTNDTLTTLTLLLEGTQGRLPVNLAITRIRRAQAPASSSSLRLTFDMRLFVGLPDYEKPHLRLAINRGAKDGKVETYSSDPGTVLRAADHLVVRIDAAALARLGRAATVHGRVLGVEFVLTPKQIRAIREFSARN